MKKYCTPPDNSPLLAWAGWQPRFSNFDVLILEGNSGYKDDGKAKSWPDSIKKTMEAFVSGGGGLVNTHATFPRFYGWPAFDEMHGLIWLHKTNQTSATGHLYPGDDNILYKCAGYQATLTRGTEWAATGKVTTMVPKDFPERDSTSLRDNLPN